MVFATKIPTVSPRLTLCRFDAEKGKSSCVGVAKAVLPLCPSAVETTPVEEEERGSK